MDMPERSFGRTVRYRRTKLGLSQAKLAELVGRTTPTIRSWERDKSRPNDPKVLSALAAILGIEEGHLFDKAGVDRPEHESSPTVEEALATLSSEDTAPQDDESPIEETEQAEPEAAEAEPALKPLRVLGSERPSPSVEDHQPEPEEPVEVEEPERERVGAAADTPAYVAPPDPYQQTPLTPTAVDVSYMEDGSQRQLYRVRTLATLVALVALVIAFIWALGEGLGALDQWWEDFFGNLRL